MDGILSLFADVRAGEGLTSLLLMMNVFLLLTAYYTIKPVREALILGSAGAEIKAYTGAIQALMFMAIVPFYSAFANRVNRLHLINGVTAFSNAWAAICVDFNGASSRIYANNFTTADSAGNAGTGAIDSVKIGQSQAGTNSLDADIAEFFGVDGAVSQAARDAARDYINARYAIGVA